MIFNFLWVAGDDIFWGQILPAVWLLALLAQGEMPRVTVAEGGAAPSWGRSRWRWFALLLFVPALLIINTATVVWPMADPAHFDKQRQHEAMLRPGDLEILPGWDQYKWMQFSADAPDVHKLVLMNMALAEEGSEQDIRRVPALIDAQLQRGGRVIVARLYDKDRYPMPWYALEEMGWPRAKIQELLSGYCHRPLETIGGIVFHELYRCSAQGGAAPTADMPASTATH